MRISIFFIYLCIVQRQFFYICVILSFVLQGCGNLQRQDDDVMANDSLVIGLCHQIKDDGTPNERILAHYILARTYVAMGDVPQAIEELQKTTAWADTNAIDCDTLLISKIHSQIHQLQAQTQESTNTAFWIVISSVLFLVLCVAGILFYKKRSKTEIADSHESKIQETEIYIRFRNHCKHPQQVITKEDWKALEDKVDEYLPNFRKKVDPNHNMKPTDYYICMLIRLYFTPSEIAAFLDITLQNLYSRRKQLLKSVFNIMGKPEEFDRLLQNQG